MKIKIETIPAQVSVPNCDPYILTLRATGDKSEIVWLERNLKEFIRIAREITGEGGNKNEKRNTI